MPLAKLTENSLLRDQFPLTFANGYRIETIGFWCRQCQEIARPDAVLGSVSRLVAEAADIRAEVHCNCGYISKFMIRLKDDKSYTWLDDGVWHRDSGKKTVWRRIWFAGVSRVVSCLISIRLWFVARKLKLFQRSLKNYPVKDNTVERERF